MAEPITPRLLSASYAREPTAAVMQHEPTPFAFAEAALRTRTWSLFAPNEPCSLVQACGQPAGPDVRTAVAERTWPDGPSHRMVTWSLG